MAPSCAKDPQLTNTMMYRISSIRWWRRAASPEDPWTHWSHSHLQIRASRSRICGADLESGPVQVNCSMQASLFRRTSPRLSWSRYSRAEMLDRSLKPVLCSEMLAKAMWRLMSVACETYLRSRRNTTRLLTTNFQLMAGHFEIYENSWII